MNILILIPVKGKSKGIPQKNLRFIKGKPLVVYTISVATSLRTAIQSRFGSCDIYVSTEDYNIKTIASLYKISVIDRPYHLTEDFVTIDEVVVHALEFLEQKGKFYDIIITLQPTSPLLRKETVENALDYFLRNNLDTLISVTPRHHLMWKKSDFKLIPLFSKRQNRQLLSPIFEENGAFVICKSEIVRNNKTRFGKKIDINPLSEEEGIDIDSPYDLFLAKTILERKKIGFIVAGNTKLGMGHVHRTLILYKAFSPPHECYFFCHKNEKEAIEKLSSLNYKVYIYYSQEELLNLLQEQGINIVINDILDTSVEYIRRLKEKGFFVVNFEDKGPGAKEAHLVINALYEWSSSDNNIFFGHKYECLREDIYLSPIKKEVNKEVKKVLITFGGTDPSDLSYRLVKILSQIKDIFVKSNIKVTMILGFGYDEERYKILKNIVNKHNMKYFLNLARKIQWMAPYIFESDFVVTSNGRTVYEIVSLGVPLIVIGQNSREGNHTFAAIHPGIKYLGIASEVSDVEIQENLLEMINNFELRKRMNEQLQKEANEIRKGIRRVINLIMKKYEDWQEVYK